MDLQDKKSTAPFEPFDALHVDVGGVCLLWSIMQCTGLTLARWMHYANNVGCDKFGGKSIMV